MNKLLVAVFTFTLISSESFAQFRRRVVMPTMPTMEEIAKMDINELYNVSHASSVVEVLGKSRGSGVVVLKEGKLVIVTNSHNLQGRKSALINLPDEDARIHNYPVAKTPSEMAQVLHDFPLSDVAILEFPEKLLNTRQRSIENFARLNGNFTPEKGWTPGVPLKDDKFNMDSLTAVLHGRPTNLEALDGSMALLLKDIFISGDESDLWAVPVFAKPGVSGGAYYKDKTLYGLVTKISLSGDPFVLATPFTKIAKLLYSTPEIEKDVSWDGDHLVYHSKDKTISLNPLRSGWIGNGGDLDVIDESVSGDSNPNYWRIESTGHFWRDNVTTTWDPFVYREGSFSVNNDNVGFVRVRPKGKSKGAETFRIPTLATFIFSERLGERQEFLQNTSQNLALLKEARLKRKTNVRRGRLYKYDREKNYFKFDSSTKRAEPFEKGGIGISPREADQDKYIYKRGGYSFGAKFSDKTIFDIRLTERLLDYGNFITATAPADLSRISLELVTLNDKRDQYVVTKVELLPDEVNSPQSLIFKSEDGKHRAILMYANDDLSLLAKAYIVTGETMIELWGEK